MFSSFKGCIHSEADVASIIYSACANRLPQVGRRMSDMEKKSIRPGDVFVYQPTASGIKRWTDGQKWSPSRISHVFMVYRNEDMTKKCATGTFSGEKYCVVVYSRSEECTGFCASRVLGPAAGVAIHHHIKKSGRCSPAESTTSSQETGGRVSVQGGGLPDHEPHRIGSSVDEDPFFLFETQSRRDSSASSDSGYRSEKFAQYMQSHGARRPGFGEGRPGRVFGDECEMYF